MPYRSTKTPYKFREVAELTAPNFVELARERLSDPAAKVIIDDARDGYGQRLYVFHEGLEIALSIRPGKLVSRGAQQTNGIQLSDVTKIMWRHARG